MSNLEGQSDAAHTRSRTDSARRYPTPVRSQAAYAAILSLELIDPDGEYRELSCEHNEDVLLSLSLREAASSLWRSKLGNRFIALMKDTSLASVVTVVELTRIAERIGSSTFRYMEMFIMVAAVYWLLNSMLSLGQAALERRLARAY